VCRRHPAGETIERSAVSKTSVAKKNAPIWKSALRENASGTLAAPGSVVREAAVFCEHHDETAKPRPSSQNLPWTAITQPATSTNAIKIQTKNAKANFMRAG
jgi:hypothetical protein